MGGISGNIKNDDIKTTIESNALICHIYKIKTIML